MLCAALIRAELACLAEFGHALNVRAFVTDLVVERSQVGAASLKPSLDLAGLYAGAGGNLALPLCQPDGVDVGAVLLLQARLEHVDVTERLHVLVYFGPLAQLREPVAEIEIGSGVVALNTEGVLELGDLSLVLERVGGAHLLDILRGFCLRNDLFEACVQIDGAASRVTLDAKIVLKNGDALAQPGLKFHLVAPVILQRRIAHRRMSGVNILEPGLQVRCLLAKNDGILLLEADDPDVVRFLAGQECLLTLGLAVLDKTLAKPLDEAAGDVRAHARHG